MAVDLSVKNVPDELADLLLRRATNNRRTLQQELLSILEAAVGRDPTARRPAAKGQQTPLTIDEIAKISRRLFPAGTESSVSYLRKQRGRH